MVSSACKTLHTCDCCEFSDNFIIALISEHNYALRTWFLGHHAGFVKVSKNDYLFKIIFFTYMHMVINCYFQALEECVDEGLVKHLGLSNFNSEQIQEVLDHSRIKPAAIQVSCFMLNTYFAYLV